MNNSEEKYISLQEATKYCHYSQEYLSLRARQGKLKAVKFGRNWVTKKEWLEEYLRKVEEYNNQVKVKKFEEVVSAKELTKVIKAQPLSNLRFGFVLALGLVLLTAGIVFGKDSLKSVYQDLIDTHFQIVNSTISTVVENVLSVPEKVVMAVSKLGGEMVEGLAELGSGILEIAKKAELTAIAAKEISQEMIGTFKEFGQWVGESIKNQIAKIRDSFVKGYEFITRPWRTPFLEEVKVVEVKKEEIEKLQAEIKELKERPAKEIVREIEVSKVTKVEPIKEITKEKIITKIDDKELAKIKKELSSFALWGRDIENFRAITQKLQAHPVQTPVPTAPLYIGSQGIQVGGIGSFASLGVSGFAGIGNLGVGGSTSLGSTPSDKLTVQATSEFNAPVFAKEGLTVGRGTLTIDEKGNLTTTGKITVKSDLVIEKNLIVHGVQTYSGLTIAGPVITSATGVLSSEAQLAISRGGTGLSALGTANQLLGVNAGATGLEYKTIAGTTNQITVTHGAGLITLATPQDIHTGATPTFGRLTLSAGTLTSDLRILDLSATWNAPTVAFTGIRLNVTDIASAPGSALLDLQTGGVSRLFVRKDGNVGIGTTAPGTLLTLRRSTAGNVFAIRNIGDTADTFTITDTGIVNLGTWQGTPIDPIYGGTGQTAVATGDILFGSAPNTWSRLAVGAAGTVLVGGTTPSWSATPSLTSLTLTGTTPLTLTGTSPVTIARNTTTADILAIDNLGTGTFSLNLVDGGLRTAGIERLTNAGALTNITGITSSGTITFSGLTIAGPVITSADGVLSSEAQLAISRGGTGLSALGTANQLLGVNAGATGLEYKTIAGTTNQITVTHGAGLITLATPQDIHTGATPTFGRLTLSAGTLTSDLRILDLSATWNAPTVAFTGIRLNVTDIASAPGSALLDLQTGGVSRLFVRKDGNVGIGTTAPATRLHVVGTTRGVGGAQILGLPTPGAPTVIPHGTTGTTTWGYRITARSAVGETLASVEGRTTTGNATLSTTNFNRITWPAVDGAVDYRIYRTTAGGTPTTTGLIGTTTLTTFDDTGLAASGAVPTIDSSGFVGIGVTAPARRLAIVDSGVGFDRPAVNSLAMYTANMERIRIDSVGNVGIGTATPGSLLDIRAPSVPELRISHDATIRARFGIATTAGLINHGSLLNSLVIGNNAGALHLGTGNIVRMTVDTAGNVGIGTTAPVTRLHVEVTAGTDAIRMNTFRFRPISATELGLFDSGGNPVVIFDEFSSPIIWGQNLSREFRQGSFVHTTTSNDRVYLEKDVNRNYYPTGIFTTVSYDYPGQVEFQLFRTTTEMPSSTQIIAQVQVSDDNFSTIKDSIIFELTTDTKTFDISSLANAKSVRVKFDFQTQDTSLTPSLISFEVWANLIESSQEESNSVAITPKPSDEKERGFFANFVQRVKDALFSFGLFIENGIAKIKELFAEKVTTKQICLEGDDGETICIDKNQLKELLIKNQIGESSTKEVSREEAVGEELEPKPLPAEAPSEAERRKPKPASEPEPETRTNR